MNKLENFLKKTASIEPIRLDVFWNTAMMHPEFGYYVTQQPLGKKGDFITAPEISQVFGMIIGFYFYDCWIRLGRPKKITLLEFGAGRGVLLRDLYHAVKHDQEFIDALCVVVCDENKVLQKQQKALCPFFHIEYMKLFDIKNLHECPVLCIANEFLDALPIRQFCFYDDLFYEAYIILDQDDVLKKVFNFPVPKNMMSEIMLPPKPPKNHDILEISEERGNVLKEILSVLQQKKGCLFLADYGHDTLDYGDTLQSVKEHGYTSLCDHIGKQDITSHVNFFVLKEICQEQNLPFAYSNQHDFFENMGGRHCAQKIASKEKRPDIITSYERIIDMDDMGKLFKVLNVENI